MKVDNITFAWGIILVLFGLLATTMSFIYFADRVRTSRVRPARKSKK